MQKIIVIGCPGSGKSTFARALHDITALPLYHLDMLYWNSDGTTVPKPLFWERLNTVLREDSWIIDGNYNATMERRLQACDTVFFLDLPTEVCLDGIRARRGKPRPDMPWVEPVDVEDAEFTEFVRNYVSESRPKVLALLEQYADRQIIVFHSRSEIDAYLKRR